MREVFEAQMKYYELERVFEWRKWAEEIPDIKFPSHWNVKIIPPFAAAMIRFLVTQDGGSRQISIYLDCYDTLGCFDEPYWEIYPHEGDTYRCSMKNTDELLEQIQVALDFNAEKAGN